MFKQLLDERWGYFLLMVAFGTIVLAFMGLSLAITATGTARFVTAMGYAAEVGYAVGSVFDLTKALLPVALLILFTRRALWFFAIIGSAWLGLVAYSCLATHATVTTAIAAIERTGTWKMEDRANAKDELAEIEERIGALVQPQIPRPSDTVRAALLSEKVPPGVWRDSQECQSIRESRYFQIACANVLKLRQELASGEDYERLNARAAELRQALASSPIMATSDPLPEAFAATIGQLLRLDGRVGVAALLTFVVEIMSCFGFAALRALKREQGRDSRSRDEGAARLEIDQGYPSGRMGRELPSAGEMAPPSSLRNVPQTSKEAGIHDVRSVLKATLREEAEPSSNVVPMSIARGRKNLPTESRCGRSRSTAADIVDVGAQVAEFARVRLHSMAGASLRASELRAAYEAWCAAHGHEPVSQQRLGAELTGLGLARRKSCGFVRYRDVQLAA